MFDISQHIWKLHPYSFNPSQFHYSLTLPVYNLIFKINVTLTALKRYNIDEQLTAQIIGAYCKLSYQPTIMQRHIIEKETLAISHKDFSTYHKKKKVATICYSAINLKPK